MDTDVFAYLCDELGYDPSTVLSIRVRAGQASVTYTEPSGMPCGRVHQLHQDAASHSVRCGFSRGTDQGGSPA